MRTRYVPWLLAAVVMLVTGKSSRAADPPLAELFRAEVGRIEAHPLQGIASAEEWKQRRPELQRQLREMMGLEPMPERGDLHATVTGTIERPDFVVEKLHYQAIPGLYVTANLYRPREVSRPLPAILYVCGHAKVEEDGLVLGNKTHYQHHAEWFAANGYVCLVVDTLQLGELPGLHHGTYREKMWWWQGRGYTPAGIEAMNGIRAIDLLLTKSYVDRDRLGVTGRSGGGATSWWLGALDDRLRVVVPVAGITDLRDHVSNPWPDGKYDAGVIEGHCDCMYFVNTYRWDFGTLAALVAPKAMLVENTNHDPIFPEPGVRRVFEQAERVYAWYGLRDRLELKIGDGGHIDSPELRHAAFAFFEKYLKGHNVSADAIDEPDRKIPDAELKVLARGEVPAGNRNDRIHEDFVKAAAVPPVPQSKQEWDETRGRWLARIRETVFGGWPGESETRPETLEAGESAIVGGLRLERSLFRSQPGLSLPLWLLCAGDADRVERVDVIVVNPDEGEHLASWASAPGSAPCPVRPLGADKPAAGTAWAFVFARGIGETAWPAAKDAHLRRRFALLGQTLDGMRVWDVRQALAALRNEPMTKDATVRLEGHGPAAPVALWAGVFEPKVEAVSLFDLAPSFHTGPAFLNVERILDTPQALALLHPREVVVRSASPETDWEWTSRLARAVSGRDWPRRVASKP